MDNDEDKIGLECDNVGTDDKEDEIQLVFNNGHMNDDKSEGDNNDEEDDLENDDVEIEDTDECFSDVGDSCEYLLVNTS